MVLIAWADLIQALNHEEPFFCPSFDPEFHIEANLIGISAWIVAIGNGWRIGSARIARYKGASTLYSAPMTATAESP